MNQLPAVARSCFSRRALLVTLAVGASIAPDLRGQAIPRDEYLRYVPLAVPRVIQQTPASARLQLYGDPTDPDYRDVAPVDGMDDGRFEVLQQLAVRFSPIMVQNTWSMPMDFKLFRENRVGLSLHIDTWNTMTRPNRLVQQRQLDFFPVAPVPCEGPIDESLVLEPSQIEALRASDCAVLELLDMYSPESPATAPLRTDALEPYDGWFQVLWLDFPGRSPDEWRRIFENPLSERLRDEYQSWGKIYAHPFLRGIRAHDGEVGYELVIQYWFFYPINDGGNNHAGDWEHINVILSPRDRVTRTLTEEETLALIDGEFSDERGDQELVIKRVDYYFHSKVMQLDYSRPNAYLPKEEWEAEVEGLIKQRRGTVWLWQHIRRQAYTGPDENQVNTHPVAYIGADNKGTDQIFASPGPRNRDSHATYPFPALYKDIGPGGATENVPVHFNHWEFYAASDEERWQLTHTFGRGGVVTFDSASKVELVPDYERVDELVRVDVSVRQQWAWLQLPIRFGYPAVQSPFAGIVAHAETGNLAIPGPSFNNGWNRSGPTAQYELYDPNLFPRFYQLGWQDGFINDWGYFNLTLPTFIMFPPFDFLWKLVGVPFRAAFGANDPTMFPSETIPLRAVSVQSGIAWFDVPNAYQDLLIQDPQVSVLVDRLVNFLEENNADSALLVRAEDVDETAVSPYYEVDFYVGRKFSSQNRFRFSESDLSSSLFFQGVEEPFEVTSRLQFNEWTGFLRYSLLSGSIQPYIKPGYGISWFRLRDIATNGVPLDDPTGDWSTQFTWSFGAGLELLVISSRAKFPKGLDFSLIAEWVRAWNGLGIEPANLPIETLLLVGIEGAVEAATRTVGRSMFFLGLNISI